MKAGQLIAQIDPRTFQSALDQAAAKKKQDEAQLSASRSTLARFEELIKKNFVAAQDLENQRQLVRQQEALVAADDAAISTAKTQLGYTRITAPIDGIAGIRQVDVGNLVTANSGTGMVVLTQVHPINVIFNLPEQNLELVRATDASTPLPVTALDRGDSHPLAEGVLKVIDNQIDTTTGTFKLKSEFANLENTLWPGQFVNVRVKVKTVGNGLVVPATAVQRGPDGSYAYVVQADSTVKMTPLKLGDEAGDNTILVTDGLNVGDKVVTEGQFRLKPGSKVQPLAPGAGGADDERGRARQVEGGEPAAAAARWAAARRWRRTRGVMIQRRAAYRHDQRLSRFTPGVAELRRTPWASPPSSSTARSRPRC